MGVSIVTRGKDERKLFFSTRRECDGESVMDVMVSYRYLHLDSMICKGNPHGNGSFFSSLQSGIIAMAGTNFLETLACLSIVMHVYRWPVE